MSYYEYRVKDDKSIPTGPHYAGVVIETKSEWSLGYDDRDGPAGYYENVTTTTYYAFPDKDILSRWVTYANQEKLKFFFFEVKKMGSLEVKVDVGV